MRVADRITLFSTCPQSKEFAPAEYLAHARRVAAWSEEAGCAGMLIYADNSIADPWLVAQAVLTETRRLCPLVAVQPVYMLPYTAAKMVATLGSLHGRRIWLNMLAGGFRNDLIALGDETVHDDRYARAIEYGLIMRRLLESEQPVSFDGQFYRVHGLRLAPRLADELLPGWMISGSSPAGRAAAIELGAMAVEYPAPADAIRETAHVPAGRGIRVGIIARDDAEEAWRVAHARFPGDRRGQLSHAMAMKTSDSSWHRTLSDLARTELGERALYWLWPFEQHRTFCPYLVGDFATVAREIGRYLVLGFTSFILDTPLSAEDLRTAAIVFDAARSLLTEPATLGAV
jgi:alkanesulfonate monooxygenase